MDLLYRDLASLAAAGFDVTGSPWYDLGNAASWGRAAARLGRESGKCLALFLTTWDDRWDALPERRGCAVPLTVPALASAALWWNEAYLKAHPDQAAIRSDGKPDQQMICGQSARVAARMKAFARQAGVPWKLGVYCGTQSESTRQSYRVDWRSLTPHLDMAAPSYEATRILAELEAFFIQGRMDAGFLGGEEAGGTTRVAWRRGKEVLVLLFNDGTKAVLTATAQVPAGCRITRQDQPSGITLQGQALSAQLEPLSCRWVVLRPLK